ncbi:MAG: segregation/condensation protein A [Alphaproteobacteria bacterium]|nr:MAG: segregation/condensation protein A [Alphaproteobacteria bacterium]
MTDQDKHQPPEDAKPDFEEDPERAPSAEEGEQLLLQLDGFDGPIDMLLSMAQDQKLDLTQISILELANQYLDFIDNARNLRLELAADYLVMAAWLAYLKSRLLIPEEETTEEPSGEQMAEALAFQLRRLEAMRNASEKLMARPQLGYDFFPRGHADGVEIITKHIWDAGFYDLLSAYADIRQRSDSSIYEIRAFKLLSIDDALARMTKMLGSIPEEWLSLRALLPAGLREEEPLVKRSAVASTFGASLEMAKRGMIEIRQEETYAPIYLRRKVTEE